MRYFALATDYDGTLAKDGVVSDQTVEALMTLRASGRHLLLVTGREMEDLRRVFEHVDLFDWVVAENGAVLHDPQTRDEWVLAEAPKPEFVEALRRKKVAPLETGRAIVATREPYETAAIETIREFGLELQVIFNKGAVMVLPSGVNKGTGLMEALKRLELSPHNVAGIGDAENDHSFLDLCELSVAVKNALPAVRERASAITRGSRGNGVRELIEGLLKDDLQSLPRKKRHRLLLGHGPRGAVVDIPAYGANLLLAGSSGGGKSTLAKAFIERLFEEKYQFCVIDPEGDYEDFEAGVVLGDRRRVPSLEEVLQVLANPQQNAVVNLLGVRLEERPVLFNRLLMGLQELRSRKGRPHWIIVDEAHHVLPAEAQSASVVLPQELTNTVMITVAPPSVLKAALDGVDIVLTVGDSPQQTMRLVARALGTAAPDTPKAKVQRGDALVWDRRLSKQAKRFEIALSSFEHHRHRRKYATGDLGPELSFYFRGSEAKMGLQARNLIEFTQIAAGLDDETWKYHLQRKDYSTWFREVIKDPELADVTIKVEKMRRLSAEESRRRIEDAISERYTLPEMAPI